MAYELASAYSVYTCNSGKSIWALSLFLFVDQSSSRRLEKIEDIPYSPEVIGAHKLNFRPKLKLAIIFVRWGVDPVLVGVCANKPWSISNACKNLRGQYPCEQPGSPGFRSVFRTASYPRNHSIQHLVHEAFRHRGQLRRKGFP